MSGPQHIAWYETALRETGRQKLLDLQVLVAPNDKDNYAAVRDMLMEMSEGQED